MDSEPRSRKVEVDEVIPPGATRSGPDPSADPLQRIVAHILDELFKIPGTNIRFGLDPLLGILPGFGDSLSNLLSTAMLSVGVRQGVPKIVIVRMAANILLNTIVGSVPVVGDAFSFWYKSNVRNYKLYQLHAKGAYRSTRSDWTFVIGLTAGLAVLVIAAVMTMLYLVALLISAI